MTKVVHSQDLPMTIHQEERLIFEFAPMNKNGIKTVLHFSKYANPDFAQTKSNGRLWLPVDLRIFNSLNTEDYAKNNHRKFSLSDAAKQLAWKVLFFKLGCFQSYHCFQMAHQWSVEMLAFSFDS